MKPTDQPPPPGNDGRVRSADGADARRGRWGLAGILAVAAGSRAAYLLWYRAHDLLYAHPLHDARVYQHWAGALAAGEAGPEGAFYQAPGYPYLLGLAYRLVGTTEPLVAYVLQTLAALVVIGLIYRIGERTYGPLAALTAAGLAALYRVYPFFETKLLSATLALLLICLAVDRLQLAERSSGWVKWVWPGLVLGLACVTRPNFLLLALCVGLWIMLDSSRTVSFRLRRCAIFVLAVMLVVIPVTLRNYRAAGDVVLISSNAGVTFYQGNNDQAEGWFSAGEFTGSIHTQREESRKLAEADIARSLSDSEISAYWFLRGLESVRKHPGRWLQLELRKAFLALDNHEHGLNYAPELDRNPFRYLFPVSFAMLLGLAAVRPFARRSVTRDEMLLLMVMLTQGATMLLFFSVSRYRLPATGALIVIAGCGLTTLVTRRSLRRIAAPVLVLTLTALLSWIKLPPGGPTAYQRKLAMPLCDVAGLLHNERRHDEALELYREAVRRNPDYTFAHLDMAKTLHELGRLEETIEAFLAAVAIAPGLAEAHYGLGLTYLRLRRLDAAASSFEKALALDPRNAGVANRLLGTYINLGDRTRATESWNRMQRTGLAVEPQLDRWMTRSLSGERAPASP